MGAVGYQTRSKMGFASLCDRSNRRVIGLDLRRGGPRQRSGTWAMSDAWEKLRTISLRAHNTTASDPPLHPSPIDASLDRAESNQFASSPAELTVVPEPLFL